MSSVINLLSISNNQLMQYTLVHMKQTNMILHKHPDFFLTLTFLSLFLLFVTGLSYKESQSERHIKETKFKCKRIARLLTDAPNPQNKGALLFKKRRQRVKKYTLVSYGTGDNKTDTEDQTEEEAEEVRTAGNNFVTTSDSELEEENSVFNQQLNLSLNWRRVREMEALPETKGKGALMFTQRRKRMDEILTEQEELKGKGLPTEGFIQPTEGHHVHDMKEMYLHTDQVDHIDANTQQMNTLFNVPKALVPNRTAKPFLGFQFHGTAPVMTVGFVPATKKPDPRFKVPVPINTSPQVWSPTGDIIASRDERISVPAIKTAILPESKRKGTKQQASLKQETHQSLHNKGERRSYIEPEEDCFSLGAEACNFMQPKATKLKNPPPVAPKPAINAQYPLLMRSPSGEPYIQPRSPGLQRSHCPMEPQSQHYLQQQDWAQPQETTKLWVPDQAQTTRQTHDNSSSKLVQTNTNSWSQRLPRSPVSMQTGSPTYSPHHPPSPTRNLSNSAQNSVASCPPQAGKSYGKALQSTSKKPFADKVGSQAGEGRTMSGKGAELFAKRQSRVEKFVVDIEKVNMKKTRSPSPTASLPNSWRYSPNIRAPPPMSYNPLLSPFYPPSAAKQAPSSSSKINSKTKEKPKSAPKHLSALDIMKHQPYQLNSSLFKYDVVSEGKGPTPKPAPPSKFEATKSLKHRFNLCHLSCNVSEPDSDCKSEASAKSSGLVSIHDSCGQQSQTGKPAIHKHLDEKHAGAPAVHHVSTKPASSIQAAGRFAQQSSADDSIASAFSPASLIARGACQMAPRPKFSAKKPVVMTKQWRPVAIMN